MMSRNSPWRSKPTTEILNLIPEAQEIKLYLMQELGPTSFIFNDDNANKVKVSIGKDVSCSCSPGKNDHCVHTLYSFLKIFQYEKENPLIWQTSYIDSELNDIIKNRFNPRQTQKTKKPYVSIKKRSTSQNGNARITTAGVVRQEIDESDVCCICHENMHEDEGLTYCKKKCGNNFHLKCVLIWAEHKTKAGDKMNCPMCRFDWGQHAIMNLREELEEFESRRFMHKGIKCGACKSPGMKWLKGKRFHCLYCEGYDLCEKCFLTFEHFEHNKFVVKELVTDKWKPARSRESAYLKTKDKKYQFVKDLQNLDKIAGVDYRIALLNMNMASYEEDKDDKKFSDKFCVDNESTMEQFMVTCFPDFGSEFDLYQQRATSLAIIGKEMKKNCVHCQIDKGDKHKLKRLFCGHIMHEDCIRMLFEQKTITCPDDGLELLKGYRTIFGGKSYAPPQVFEKQMIEQHIKEQRFNETIVNGRSVGSTLYQLRKPKATNTTKKDITMLIRKGGFPVSPKSLFNPAGLDVTGKNIVPPSKNQNEIIEMLPTDRYDFLKNDRKKIGKTFLKPPKHPLQILHRRMNEEQSNQRIDMMNSIGIVQGVMLATRNSHNKLEAGNDSRDKDKLHRENSYSVIDNGDSKRATDGRRYGQIDENSEGEVQSPYRNEIQEFEY
jgi:ribosomal protein S17E